MMGQYTDAKSIVDSCDAVKSFISKQKEVSTLWMLWNYVETSDLSFKDWCINLTKEKFDDYLDEMTLLTMDCKVDMESDDYCNFS